MLWSTVRQKLTLCRRRLCSESKRVWSKCFFFGSVKSFRMLACCWVGMEIPGRYVHWCNDLFCCCEAEGIREPNNVAWRPLPCALEFCSGAWKTLLSIRGSLTHCSVVLTHRRLVVQYAASSVFLFK